MRTLALISRIAVRSCLMLRRCVIDLSRPELQRNSVMVELPLSVPGTLGFPVPPGHRSDSECEGPKHAACGSHFRGRVKLQDRSWSLGSLEDTGLLPPRSHAGTTAAGADRGLAAGRAPLAGPAVVARAYGQALFAGVVLRANLPMPQGVQLCPRSPNQKYLPALRRCRRDR